MARTIVMIKDLLEPLQGTNTAAKQQGVLARHVIVEAILLVALLGMVALVFAFAPQQQITDSVDLTIKEPPTRLEWAGFHIPERNEEFGYSWSTSYAFADLPGAFHAAPAYIASLYARDANPTPDQPQQVTLYAGDRPLVTTPLSRSLRVYHVLIPQGESSKLRFGMETPTFRLPSDARELGFVATGIAVQPITRREIAPIIAILLGVLFLWLTLRARGTTTLNALAVCAAFAATLLVLFMWYQPSPLSYATLCVIVTGSAILAGWLARETAARAALVVMLAVSGMSGALWQSWLTDDAFISFRYAQNLVAGHGLVYNIGERVEGYTNFLWTMLAALVLWLGGDVVAWSHISGVVLALALVLTTYWCGARLIGKYWGLIAALVVATAQSLLIYTARGAGLETGLFALLTLAGCYLAWEDLERRRAPVRAALVFALATLTRPEGALLMALTLAFGAWLVFLDHRPAAHHIQSWQKVVPKFRRLAAALGVFLLLVLPFTAWRVSYYGDLLPNTFYVKTGGGLAVVERGFSYTLAFAWSLGGPLLIGLLLPALRSWRKTIQHWNGFMLLIAAMYTAYIVRVGGDHFPGERFFVPLVPLLALLMADGAAHWFVIIGRTAKLRATAATVTVVSALVFGWYALQRTQDSEIILRGNDESVHIWTDLGHWMAQNTAPNESIAALGAGAIAYYSDRPVIDLLGLTEKHIARVEVADFGTGTAGHEKRDPGYVLNVRKPTYIPQMWDSYFGGAEALQDQYTLITIRTPEGRPLKLWKRQS
jgi:hypothetical protein